MANGKPGRPKGLPKTGGRKPGTTNKVTTEAREAASALVDDAKYRANLQKRLRSGKIAPAVETMIWAYAKGKPVERHEVGAPGSFAEMTDQQLKDKLAEIATRL